MTQGEQRAKEYLHANFLEQYMAESREEVSSLLQGVKSFFSSVTGSSGQQSRGKRIRGKSSRLYKKLSSELERTLETYYHSRPLFHLDGTPILLRDFGAACAITNTDLLLVGSSGAGKTAFAQGMLAGCFGERFSERNLNPETKPNDFVDVDTAKLKKGSKHSEAINPGEMVESPGVILNEINRAPPLIQNILMNYLENKIHYKQVGFDTGVRGRTGERYQWRIMSLNNGDEYTGAIPLSDVDRAIKSRCVAVINIDYHPSTREDDMMFENSTGFELPEKLNDLTDLVLELSQRVDDIGVEEDARFFLRYLQNMDNCIYSPTQTKKSFTQQREYCKQCTHGSREKSLCTYTEGPEKRLLGRMMRLAKGITFVRRMKDPSTPSTATLDDLAAVAPHVMYHKNVHYDPEWLAHNFVGSDWKATEFAVETAKRGYLSLKQKHPDLVRKVYGGAPLSQQDIAQARDIVQENDIRAFNLNHLE